MNQLHAACHITEPSMFSDFIIPLPKSHLLDYVSMAALSTGLARWQYYITVPMVIYRQYVNREGQRLQLPCDKGRHNDFRCHDDTIFHAQHADNLHRPAKVQLGCWGTDDKSASTVVFPVIADGHLALLCVGEGAFNECCMTLY